MFLAFERKLFYAITHLTVAKYSHALNLPNDFAIPNWEILYVDPFLVVVAVMWVFAVFTNVLSRLFVAYCVSDFIFFHIHVANLKICFLQI